MKPDDDISRQFVHTAGWAACGEMEQIRDDCIHFAQEQDWDIHSCKGLRGCAVFTQKH